MTPAVLPEPLDSLLAERPQTARVVGAILSAWPDHAKFLEKSFGARSPEQMDTSEEIAGAALTLIGDRLPGFAEDYVWLCARVREEELFFFREERYRLSTFAEAFQQVYDDFTFMSRYMNALLITDLVWYNHLAGMHFYRSRGPDLMVGEKRFLEVGPGHGLLLFLALRDFAPAEAAVWDISEASMAQTRHALAALGRDPGDVDFVMRNIVADGPSPDQFDTIVFSEVLEHLEDPDRALRYLRSALAPDGRMIVNVPLNSPAPDHLFLLRSPEEAVETLRRNGFNVLETALFATRGMDVDRALRQKASVSCWMIAAPA